MVTWSYAYQAARKGPWEIHARDRMRFKRRIDSVEMALEGIFDKEHREKVFAERFASECAENVF